MDGFITKHQANQIPQCIVCCTGTPQTPIALSRGYGLGGGFSLMDPQDIDKICQIMSLNVLEAPGNSFFTDCPLPNPTQSEISDLHIFNRQTRKVRQPKTEISFPAHEGLVSDEDPVPRGIVSRLGDDNGAPVNVTPCGNTHQQVTMGFLWHGLVRCPESLGNGKWTIPSSPTRLTNIRISFLKCIADNSSG